MGPACSILLDKKIDLDIIVEVDEFLSSISSNKFETPKVSRDIWINTDKFPKITSEGSRCGFYLSYNNKQNTLDEDLLTELELALEFIVQSEISIAAGCNQQGDHNILAELIFEIANITGGFIDYGYDILKNNYGNDKKLKGFIYSVELNYGKNINHIVDTEFFKNWLVNNKDYLRMIK